MNQNERLEYIAALECLAEDLMFFMEGRDGERPLVHEVALFEKRDKEYSRERICLLYAEALAVAQAILMQDPGKEVRRFDDGYSFTRKALAGRLRILRYPCEDLKYPVEIFQHHYELHKKKAESIADVREELYPGKMCNCLKALCAGFDYDNLMDAIEIMKGETPLR